MNKSILSRQNSTIPAIVNDNAAHKLLEENTDDFFFVKAKRVKLGRKKLVSTNIYASLKHKCTIDILLTKVYLTPKAI